MNKKIIGVICAVEAEKEAFFKRYKSYANVKIYDLTFYLFNIKNIDVIMVKCGTGKINATRATQVLIDKFNIDIIINYGTAGGLEKSISYGDVIIAKSCVQFDADCSVLGVPKGKFDEDDELYIKTDDKVLEYVKNKLDFLNYNVKYENIATFDQFIIDKAFNENIYNEFGAVCADMESVAIAITAKRCKIPFVIIRVITNILEDKDPINSYERLKHEMSEKCIDVFEQLI